MDRIDNMLDSLSRLSEAFIEVHQERCVLVRNRNALCLKCAEACTSGCISYDTQSGTLAIAAEKCTGCGTCATACPTEALEATAPDDAELFEQCLLEARRLESADRIYITCRCLAKDSARRISHSGSSPARLSESTPTMRETSEKRGGKSRLARAVSVACLGRVDESLLVMLAAQGIRNITLVHGACETCVRAKGRLMTDKVVQTVQTLARAWEFNLDIRLAAELPPWVCAIGGKPPVRSQSTARLQSAYSASNEQQSDSRRPPRYVKVSSDGTLPHFFPLRRRRLIAALTRLGQPKDVSIRTHLWGHVTIDAQTCVSCGMCVVFCPTGALRTYADNEGTAIDYYPGACVHCSCCQSICPAHAITLSDETFAPDIIAGATDRFDMGKPPVERGKAHSIRNSLRYLMDVPHVYER